MHASPRLIVAPAANFVLRGFFMWQNWLVFAMNSHVQKKTQKSPRMYFFFPAQHLLSSDHDHFNQNCWCLGIFDAHAVSRCGDPLSDHVLVSPHLCKSSMLQSLRFRWLSSILRCHLAMLSFISSFDLFVLSQGFGGVGGGWGAGGSGGVCGGVVITYLDDILDATLM